MTGGMNIIKNYYSQSITRVSLISRSPIKHVSFDRCPISNSVGHTLEGHDMQFRAENF